MRKRILGFWLVIAGYAFGNDAAFLWPDPRARVDAEAPSSAKNRIDLGKGIFVDLTFEITTNGNGLLTLPGLAIRVFDSHADGLVFRNGLLRCEWQDVDGDGVRELVVTGTAIRQNDQAGADEGTVQIRGVFRYVAKERRFETVICSPEIYQIKDKA
ncbi:MAG: hypothetical protein NTV51_25340 [Verrucomicrobia bacterium]|nr:hypothetical protein [Verrucomicrobiota bacterium]